MLKGKIYLNEQEESGNCKYTGVRQFMACGFRDILGEEASAVAFTALALILEHYPDNADYLQTFEYHLENVVIRFWCINDGEHITFLLPEEY